MRDASFRRVSLLAGCVLAALPMAASAAGVEDFYRARNVR